MIHARIREMVRRFPEMVYHEREPSEHPELYESIETSVATDEHRREVREMKRSMADVLMEQGEIRALQRTLLTQVHTRFGEVPEGIAATVEATTDVAQLDAWLNRLLTASTWEELAIAPPRRRKSTGGRRAR